MAYLVSLVPVSVLIGIGMLVVFRRVSNPAAIARAKSRMAAHVYEMRLFPDEPVLIWSAQWGLLRANIRYIGLMLAPALVMSIPLLAVLSALEGYYGVAPLPVGQASIVTVQLKTPWRGPAPELRAPEGIAVETPGVRLAGGRQISWRIRASRPASGSLEFRLPGETVEKSIDAAAGPRYLSSRRVSSWMDLLLHPAEAPISSTRVDWIQVRYPGNTIDAMGLQVSWLVWLLVISMITAIVLKRRFRVTF
jgi:hypothetical protein